MLLSRLVDILSRLDSKERNSDGHIGSPKMSHLCYRSRKGDIGRRRFAPDETNGWSIRESVPELARPEGNQRQRFLLGIQSVRCTVAGLRRD